MSRPSENVAGESGCPRIIPLPMRRPRAILTPPWNSATRAGVGVGL